MAERVLVIDAHPDRDRGRLCHALAEAYAEGAREAGKQARLITLAEMDFPLLRTAAEFTSPSHTPSIASAAQDMLWGDHIAIIFPLWLGGAPALLHGFLEQCARGDFFAETVGAGIRQKLKGRSARLIVTMGMPAAAYRLMFGEHGVKRIAKSVLGFAGVAPVRTSLFGMVEAASDPTRKSWIARVRALGAAAR